MQAEAAYAVALGIVLLVRSVALDCFGVMMCLRAQRRGCKVCLELEHAGHRLRFTCEAVATRETRDAPDGRAGEHHS